ncbi:MAG: amino acid adenylation domain-containing protein, partial [Caulobacteraceae bacterium]
MEQGAPLHDLFAGVARRYPDNVALSYADCGMTNEDGGPVRREAMSYASLDARADAFSRHLIRRGVCAGDRVVIHLPRGLAQYWALLGVMKAGAAYVPVDWSFPRERIQTIAADCAARAIVTWGAGDPELAGDGLERIDLAGAGAAIADEAGWGPACPTGSISPEDIAYIIYTSGSTGQPKGVMIRHRNARHFVEAESSVLGLTERDRVFGAFSLAFDMSIETMWTAWRAGAELICASEELARSSHDLPAVLAARGVSVWHVTPSLLGAVDEDVPSLRLINLGGEACPAALVERWWRPGRRLVNTYGPTETAVTATWAELTPDRPVTIGRALPGYHTWIVDDALRPVAPGAVGELVIGGAGVGAGYVGRPKLTADKFIDAPHLVAAGPVERTAKVYRTGDLARLAASGEIEFLGRADTQIKVRGYRVELEEIESVLAEHPQIGQAAVKLFSDDAGGDHLAAFLVGRTGETLDLAGVRADLSGRLPSYMRPQSFTLLSGLPTGVSGKVDRNALPRPAETEDEQRVIEPPASGLESSLLNAWAAVFPARRIGVLDHFFDDLGGHSLIAARMVSAARHDAPLARLSIQDVYRAPTIRGLAARVAATADRLEPSRPRGFVAAEPWRRWGCVTAQTVALVCLFGVGGLQWVFPYLVFEQVAPRHGSLAGFEGAALAFTAIPPLMTLLAVALKWLVIGKVRAGDYPLWGVYYFRWWLSERAMALAP